MITGGEIWLALRRRWYRTRGRAACQSDSLTVCRPRGRLAVALVPVTTGGALGMKADSWTDAGEEASHAARRVGVSVDLNSCGARSGSTSWRAPVALGR